MPNYKKIDIENWDRKAYFEAFGGANSVSYSVCVNIEITAIIKEKLYPAMLFLLTKTANEFDEFKTEIVNDEIVVFDRVCPRHTLLNDKNNFVAVWTECGDDYSEFLASYESNVLRYKSANCPEPQGSKPKNCFDTSMVPWIEFLAINHNQLTGVKSLMPVFTLGKYAKKNKIYTIPLAIQAYHSVCDGFHISKFLEKLQENINNFNKAEF